jgi:hypothetical protein
VLVTIDSLTLVKFGFAIAGFVFLTLYGARSRRTVGVLLTFPLLNGIALLNSPEPFRVAGAIYPLVMFNCVLFWLAIGTVQWLPPKRNAFPEFMLLVTRIIVWGTLWVFFAYQLTDFRDQIPTVILLVTYGALACGATFYCWRRLPAPAQTKTVRSTLWLNWAVRISLFTLVFFCILYVTQHASDQKWAGMASSLPLPGLFALAALSVTNGEAQLMPIRDTVLLGPFLVVPFNWLFAEVVTVLPSGPTGAMLGIFALTLAWVVALLLVFRLLPALETYLDGRSR